MLNKSDITGRVYYKGPVEQITANMTKIVVVVEYQNGNRVEKVPVEFINPTNVFDSIKVNSQVVIGYVPGGNEHNGKFYASLKGQSIAKI